MSEVLIARFKSKREADAVTKFIKQHSASSTLVRGKNLEDLWLGEMIEEGMKKNIPVTVFKKYLEKRIKEASR